MQPDDTIRKINIQLRYYLRIDPDSLTDKEWADRFQELVWIRQEEAKANDNR